jgi:hypothetical protein
LTWGFRDLAPSNDEGRVRQATETVLPALSHVVDFCKDFPIASKKKLFLAIKSTIEHAVILFPVYAKYSEISNCILIFFLNVLRVLQQQLGVEGTKSAGAGVPRSGGEVSSLVWWSICFKIVRREQEAGNFLDKLLQIFQLVVESPGTSYKKFSAGDFTVVHG